MDYLTTTNCLGRYFVGLSLRPILSEIFEEIRQKNRQNLSATALGCVCNFTLACRARARRCPDATISAASLIAAVSLSDVKRTEGREVKLRVLGLIKISATVRRKSLAADRIAARTRRRRFHS
jgi:hypothetical protein